MCRTFTITYMLCLHTRIDHQPCPRSRSFLALFLSTCKEDISEININDFCLECRKFWDEEAISETARRELAQSFRIVNAYHGELTPVKDEMGVISFREAGELGLGQQVSDSASMVTAHGMDDDVTTVCMLNAQYNWLAVGDEPLEEREPEAEDKQSPEHEREQEPEQEPEQAPEPEQPQSPRSRRDSNSSTLTIWPSGFDEIPMFETDEFGNQVEVPSVTPPVAAHLARHGYIHPDEFEMENLNEPLPGTVDGGGFEIQRVLRPAAPIANALPHRGSGELVKPDRSFAEPSRVSAKF
ncbi:hypothetical protein DL98DRAFT_588658 [Cadophora sp. DSE1049]|nr:hypothetical protein DL98DRAFT_588658 [Cadophora sp. DSE1049]